MDVPTLLKLATEDDICYNRDEHFPPNWDVTQGDAGITVTYAQDDDDTVTSMALRLTEELGILKPPAELVVYAALGPGDSTPLVYALCDNWHWGKRPGGEVVRRVREAFGFEGEPAWWPSSLEVQWTERRRRY